MLDNLLISKVRIKMLKQFLYNKEESYHVRALVRELNEEINAVRRELQNLEEIGLLTSQKKGNKLVYTLVSNHSFVKPLYELLRKDEDEVVKVTKIIQSLGEVNAAVLTEHFFYGNHKDNTDVDLLVVSEAHVKDINAVLRKVEETLGREVRAAALRTSEVPFYIKKRDPLLLSVLSKDRITLIGSDKDLYKYE